ncbi:MAG: ABC transporter permease [Pyrinomonadaceae bacterium]|nr:ABC transporter permease [Pyrinomonadaceae bacterium]
MRSPALMAFGAVFQTEVLLNTKRVAPYAMAILCGGNALLWWGWGPATGRGWAINSDFFITGVLPVYSFMTLPLFTALIMADPVIRDFRTGVAPLIFSKPLSRAEYLLGKFFGNFFVLVCCQSAFVIMLFALQAFRRPGMVVQEVRALPYLKHFLVFVVISHLALAAFYFTVGTLTRNVKIVYGLGVFFYPLYITYQVVLLKRLPSHWKSVLDPLLMNWGDKSFHSRSAEWANQFIATYDSNLIANRALMLLITIICLTILYLRFSKTERVSKVEDTSKLALLNLSTRVEEIYNDAQDFPSARNEQFEFEKDAVTEPPALPVVSVVNQGARAHLKKLAAALGIEFRLLRAERSLVLLIPLAGFLATLEQAFYVVVPEVSYSASYASGTAGGLSLFLYGMAVFYTGEAMHRDREVRIQPVLWSAPAPNLVLLLSKFLATVLLALSLIAMVAVASITIQIFRGHTPVDFSAYLSVYTIILIPSVIFITGISVMLNVLLRDKYLTYAVSLGLGIGLFYLYGQGYNHWLYNPVLYKLWTYADLTGAGNSLTRILIHRVYWLAITSACLALAHLCFERKAARGFIVNNRLSSAGWSSLIAVVSVAAAVIAGLSISSMH